MYLFNSLSEDFKLSIFEIFSCLDLSHVILESVRVVLVHLRQNEDGVSVCMSAPILMSVLDFADRFSLGVTCVCFCLAGVLCIPLYSYVSFVFFDVTCDVASLNNALFLI